MQAIACCIVNVLKEWLGFAGSCHERAVDFVAVWQTQFMNINNRNIQLFTSRESI